MGKSDRSAYVIAVDLADASSGSSGTPPGAKDG